MNQIDLITFLAPLSPKDKVEVQEDIDELKKWIWERVALPPVPDSLCLKDSWTEKWKFPPSINMS